MWKHRGQGQLHPPLGGNEFDEKKKGGKKKKVKPNTSNGNKVDGLKVLEKASTGEALGNPLFTGSWGTQGGKLVPEQRGGLREHNGRWGGKMRGPTSVKGEGRSLSLNSRKQLHISSDSKFLWGKSSGCCKLMTEVGNSEKRGGRSIGRCHGRGRRKIKKRN